MEIADLVVTLLMLASFIGTMRMWYLEGKHDAYREMYKSEVEEATGKEEV